MFDDERRLLRVHDEPLDHLSRDDALLRVQVRARLVDQVDVGGDAKRKRDGDALELAAGQVQDGLVHQGLHQQGPHDVGDELRVEVRVPDPLVQQLTDRARELGGDLLRLVRDAKLRHLDAVVVRRQQPPQHPDERGLPRAVLAQHDDDLGIGEVSGLDRELEGALRLGHSRVGEARVPLAAPPDRRRRGLVVAALARLLLPLAALALAAARGRRCGRRGRGRGDGGLRLAGVDRDLEAQGLLAEPQVLGGNKPRQEDVDPLPHGERQRDDAVSARLPVEAADEVGEVVEDGQVVLDDDDVLLGAQQRADDLFFISVSFSFVGAGEGAGREEVTVSKKEGAARRSRCV